MSIVVISQPMFFPWVGLFEQIKLADIYVHYDDVQLPQGRSFISRVQIKTKDGIKWLTVPLKKGKSGSLICNSFISYEENWIDKHLKFLKSNFHSAVYKNDMLAIVESIYKEKHETISMLNIHAIESIAKYFDFFNNKKVALSSELGFHSQSSKKLLDVVEHFNGTNYVTGWGARNYIDYKIFEDKNIDVQFMDYQKKPYTQLYGDFTPFVSILDLIANVGKRGDQYIISNSKSYKTYIPYE